jgi:hypothetical protein
MSPFYAAVVPRSRLRLSLFEAEDGEEDEKSFVSGLAYQVGTGQEVASYMLSSDATAAFLGLFMRVPGQVSAPFCSWDRDRFLAVWSSSLWHGTYKVHKTPKDFLACTRTIRVSLLISDATTCLERCFKYRLLGPTAFDSTLIAP